MIKNITLKIRIALNRLNIFKRLISPFYPKTPIYIFHHMPKCGGTSLSEVLNKWFIVVRDYRKDWESIHKDKIDLKKLRSIHCLAGHWELPSVFLNERYPEVFNDNKFIIFTFLRDPLEHSLSLYRYEKENNQTNISDIEKHFLIRPNYMATILNATKENYKEVVDRYAFIGILEKMETSIKILSDIVGKKYYQAPKINKTHKSNTYNSEKLSQSIIKKFKEMNNIDYLIYNYSLQKLSKYKVDLS